MKIGISRKCLGGNLDLLLDGDMCAWQDGVPEDHWVCGDRMRARDIGTIAQAMGQSLLLDECIISSCVQDNSPVHQGAV